MNDLHKKHCRICQKILTLDDAFESSNPNLCEFCDRFFKIELPSEKVNLCISNQIRFCEPVANNIVVKITEDKK